MTTDDPIVTSRTAISTYLQCARKRWHAYECPNGTPVAGWETRKLALPLATGIYGHEAIEGLLMGLTPRDAAAKAVTSYKEEATRRGVDVENGAVEGAVIEEQAAYIEAVAYAFARVRLPFWHKEYEVVEVEQEDRVPLSDDVILAVRADAIVRRKADGRMFVVNFKTVGSADERWMRQWEVDMQLMTELLAAERRHGGEFGGVIIEGIVKGPRVKVDAHLSEVRDSGKEVAGVITRNKLLYGYKRDADLPLKPLEYSCESQRAKGWYKFPVWRETFPVATQTVMSPIEYWVNWLDLETVENQFVTVPPIARDAQRIKSKVTQIVEIERTIAGNIGAMQFGATLDEIFPQNEHACTYPGRCAMYDMCWTGNVAEDPQGSGLYLPRRDHHAIAEGE